MIMIMIMIIIIIIIIMIIVKQEIIRNFINISVQVAKT